MGVEAIERVVDEQESRGQSWLVGKLIADKIIEKESIRNGLLSIWKPLGFIYFKVFGENLFLLDFELSTNKKYVLDGRLWIFEGQFLFAVEELNGFTPPSKMYFDSIAFWIYMYDLPMVCMEREMGLKLGSTVRKVEEVDTN